MLKLADMLDVVGAVHCPIVIPHLGTQHPQHHDDQGSTAEVIIVLVPDAEPGKRFVRECRKKGLRTEITNYITKFAEVLKCIRDVLLEQ